MKSINYCATRSGRRRGEERVLRYARHTQRNTKGPKGNSENENLWRNIGAECACEDLPKEKVVSLLRSPCMSPHRSFLYCCFHCSSYFRLKNFPDIQLIAFRSAAEQQQREYRSAFITSCRSNLHYFRFRSRRLRSARRPECH